MTDIMDIDPAQMKPRKVTKKKRVKRVLIHLLFFKLINNFHNPHPIIIELLPHKWIANSISIFPLLVFPIDDMVFSII